MAESTALGASDMAADRAAVADTNFCSLWPTARQALQLLVAVISNPLVKIAVNTVIAAGNAYCGSSNVTVADVKQKLSASGINSIDDLANQVVSRAGSLNIAADSDWIISHNFFVGQ